MTDLDQLSAEDLERLLAGTLGDDEMVIDMADLGNAILTEIQSRLGSPEKRKEIPGTVLMQLGRDVMKAREAERNKATEDDEDPPSLSEIVEAAGLPNERKRELLRAEINRLQTELDHLNHLLDLYGR